MLLKQYDAELEDNILMWRLSVELASHSSDKPVGLLKKRSKNLLLLAVAVGDLVTGNCGQYFAGQLMVNYYL